MRETICVLLVDDNKLTCTAVRHVLLGVVDILLLDEIATKAICPEAKILLLVTNCTGSCRADLTGDNVLGCLLRDIRFGEPISM